MISKAVCLLVVLSILFDISCGEIPDDGKLRVCIVEARGHYRRAPQFCPLLEATSNMECVVGIDRLDCVRRIHKGTAHFGVLSSEDLVAARWASVEILVASELRSHNSPFEYEIVAVVDNEADIHTVHDLRGAKLCHPGYGLKNHWTDVLANYLESTMVSKSCDPEISISEDRIRSSSRFFGPSCKAGPWVPNQKEDRQLKDRYPSLCQMCYDPYRCDIGDKHWGRRGALYCLTSGGGSVAWARLDDVRSHFGLSGLQAQANPSEYSYLCIDGHLQPINATKPCVWVAKPWPVIAARRTHAAQVQHLVTGLSHDSPSSWQNALLSLLENFHVEINPLDNVIPIDDYLDQATGFQSAYSFPECNPPRSVVFCTTSIIEHIKCSWLQEASQVYGVQPNIQCIRSATLDTCMDDIKYKAADLVVVDNEQRLKAQREYKLKPILYEFSQNMHDLYTTVAVIHKNAKFNSFKDLEGAVACLPSYEGPAYLSMLETIRNQTGQLTSPHKYFSRDSCLWHGDKTCSDVYRGDEGALRCLAQKGEVAFISSATYKQYIVGNLTSAWIKQSGHKSFQILCPYGNNERYSKFEFCYMHWTTRSYIMTHDGPQSRQNEIYNSLREIDGLFGKQFGEDIRPFTMYGAFDKQNNVIFRDQTDELRGLREIKNDINSRTMEDIYDDYIMDKYKSDIDSGAVKLLNEKTLDEQLRKFDNRLYYELAKKHPNSNIILSPFSVQTCIAMSRMGASGNTACEMDRVFISSDQNPNHLALHYYNILKNYQNSSILKIANKIYIKPNIKVKEEFNKLLNEKFFSSVEAVDFSNGQVAASTINSWIEDKTNNLIKDLVSPNVFNNDTRLVLVNAIHFKGEWVYQFNKKDTKETDFHADKNTFKVQMMYRKADFSYGFLRDLNAEAVELPYRDSDLSMLVILPRRNTNLLEVEEKLKNISLADLSNKMRVSEIEVYLPKFDAEFKVELSEPLQELGMRRMFSREAEFDRILAGESHLHVSSMIHKAAIEVNEKGAEAAAATDAVLTPHILGVIFFPDRPFHYIIKNKNTTFFEGNFIGEPKIKYSQ